MEPVTRSQLDSHRLPPRLATLVRRAERGNWPWRLIVAAQVLIGFKAVVALLGILTLDPFILLIFILTQGVLLIGVILFVVGVASLVRGCDVEHYAAGEHIFASGDSAEHIYVVTSGTVALAGQRPGGGDFRREIHGGDYFGELATLGGRCPRVLTATAVTDTKVLKFAPSTFMKLYQTLPEIRQHFERGVMCWAEPVEAAT